MVLPDRPALPTTEKIVETLFLHMRKQFSFQEEEEILAVRQREMLATAFSRS